MFRLGTAQRPRFCGRVGGRRLWLFTYYRSAATDEQRDFIVPVCNLLAYLIGASR